jgi:hypothetical protein
LCNGANETKNNEEICNKKERERERERERDDKDYKILI